MADIQAARVLTVLFISTSFRIRAPAAAAAANILIILHYPKDQKSVITSHPVAG